jgi:hypothetical protein
MAIDRNTIKLTDGVRTLNLMDGVNYALTGGEYEPVVPSLKEEIVGRNSPYEDVVESIEVVCLGETHNQALDNLHALSDLLDQAHRWGKGAKVAPVRFIIKPVSRTKTLESVIIAAPDPVQLTGEFVKKLQLPQIPVTVQFTRRAYLLDPRQEQGESNSYNTFTGITPMNVELSQGRGVYDLEIHGFKTTNVDEGDAISKAVIEEGFLIATSINRLNVFEAEDLDRSGVDDYLLAKGYNFTIEGDAANYIMSNRASGSSVIVINSTEDSPYFEKALATKELDGTNLEGVEEVGVFVMIGAMKPGIEYQIRAVGYSYERIIAGNWSYIDFDTDYIEQEDYPDIEYLNRSRPVFLGTLSALGGFTRIGFQVKPITPLDEQIPYNQRLTVDYMALVDMGDESTRVLHVPRYGATFVESPTGTEIKLVFNTGALGLLSPRCYVALAGSNTYPSNLYAGGSGLRIPGELPILYYKYPSGDGWLECNGQISVVWFGRGIQAITAGYVPASYGSSIPNYRTNYSPETFSPLTLKVKVFRNKAYLLPR